MARKRSSWSSLLDPFDGGAAFPVTVVVSNEYIE